MRCLGVVLALLGQLWASPAAAWDLPPGTWRSQKSARPHLELRLGPKRSFVITIRDTPRIERQIAGKYRVRATKHNFQSATFKVQGLGSRVRKKRRDVLQRRLAATRAFGVEIRLEQALSFTLVGGCVDKRDSLQLCLHAKRAGRPHVRCQTLYQPRRRACPPPIDGSLYNRPPVFHHHK